MIAFRAANSQNRGDKETDRYTDRQTDRQAGRQGGETDIEGRGKRRKVFKIRRI